MDEPTIDDRVPSAREAPTVADAIAAKRRPAQASDEGSAPSAATQRPTMDTVTSPAEALRSDEMARSRGLAALGTIGSLITCVAAPLFEADAIALAVLLVGMGCLFFSNAYLFFIARSPATYTEGRLLAVWVVATFGVNGAVFFFGPLSAVAAALILGIYVSGRNTSRRVAWATYLTAAVLHGITALAPLVFGLPRVGHLEPTNFGALEVVLAELMLQLIFVGTYATAASSRRTMGRILADLEAAIREVARREVQLDEAREDFQRALPIGGAGRLTGTKLGSFTLGVLLGRGGMGEVYEGASATGGEPAAVKVLLPQAGGSGDDAVSRFLREARAASSLDSPHVVRVLEIGEPPAELPFMAMERLRGHDLSEHLRGGAPMTPADVVEMVRQIGRGLAAARAGGIVHRDIKPQNLYRVEAPGSAGLWKILDFGVSKLGASTGTLTRGRLLGTPSYMAPEQALAEAVDHRADLYALGAVAYRCLVGRPPFRSGDMARVIYRVVHRMPPRPSAHASLHPHVDLLFAIALAKEPADRLDDGEALADALAAALDGVLEPALQERGRHLLAIQDWS
ncbi:MAG: serine/threonine protein kinase [Sandaracinaceae bacterium]|nr:serine/threonine protein kinase [Sandaracinaceae bacterium]